MTQVEQLRHAILLAQATMWQTAKHLRARGRYGWTKDVAADVLDRDAAVLSTLVLISDGMDAHDREFGPDDSGAKGGMC